MKCKLEKLEIPTDQPFKNCKLDREKYAEVLKAIITTYDKGFVLAINGKWGTGKTTFVEMWKAYLELDGFHTLYFNAWENDFISDPLVGLLGELKGISLKTQTAITFTSILSALGKITIKAGPSILKAMLKGKAGEEVLNIISDFIEEGSAILSKEIDNYESQKKNLEFFQNELKRFVDEACDKKPLIFIIDELDRCNPHYAVKTLERIKHLFNIPNITFVLSIDKEQLSNSIRGYYGSDLIDANEYLKRFIDIEYTLPEPDIESFCEYLFNYYDFTTFFLRIKQLYFKEGELDNLGVTAVSIFKYKKTTLRQIEKIFANIRLSLNMFNDRRTIFTDLLCLLTYLRICESDFYEKITHREYSIQEIVNQIEFVFPKQLFDLDTNYNIHYNRRFYFTIAFLLECYITTPSGKDSNQALLTHEEKGLTIAFDVNVIDKEQLIASIGWVKSNSRDLLSLEEITTKINLLENLRT